MHGLLHLKMVSYLTTLIGGLRANATMKELQDWVPYLLGIAAASMLYVSVADLIPGLHKRPELRATVEQVLLISLGIGSIVLVDIAVGKFI